MRTAFTRPTKQWSKAAEAGLAAKRNGQSAEEIVENTAEYLAEQGLADLEKRYEPYKRVSRGSGTTFRGVYLGKSGCDYALWLPDGRAGMIEVKSREGMRVETSAVDSKQAEQLGRRSRWGQLAFVLVRLSSNWFLVPWSNWLHEDRKSHNLEQLGQVGFKLTESEGILNLMDALKYFS